MNMVIVWWIFVMTTSIPVLSVMFMSKGLAGPQHWEIKQNSSKKLWYKKYPKAKGMTDLVSFCQMNCFNQSNKLLLSSNCSSVHQYVAWTGGELHLTCAAVRVLLRLVHLLSHRVKHLSKERSVRWSFFETTDLVLVGCLKSSHDLQNFNLKNVCGSSSPPKRPSLPSAWLAAGQPWIGIAIQGDIRVVAEFFR